MNQLTKRVLSHPINFMAFGFGSGLAPKAPGTWGTLAAIPFFLILSYLPIELYIGFILVASVLGIMICGHAADDLKVHDHPGIVWDEFVGFWITMIAAPVSLGTVCLGFVLFRVFDIFKPWPIKWVDQQVSGGLGIMLDDILAGLMACAVMHCLLYLLV